MFFEMRFDLGTLDSGERSLPFGLLVSFEMDMKKIKDISDINKGTDRSIKKKSIVLPEEGCIVVAYGRKTDEGM